MTKEQEDKLEAQAKKMQKRGFDKHPWCLYCDKPMIQLEDNKYTWRFDCKCNPENLMLSTG